MQPSPGLRSAISMPAEVPASLKRSFKMKEIKIILLVALLCCKQVIAQTTTRSKEHKEKNGFTISGHLNGNYAGLIYLTYGNKKDSVVIVNNRFAFKGSVTKPTQGWLNLEPRSTVAWLYVENNDIRLEATAAKSVQDEKPLNRIDITNIAGSYSAKIQEEYQDFYQSNKARDNFKALLFAKLDTFIEKNRTHPFSGTILAELASITPVLSRNELVRLYAKIDTTKQNSDDVEMFNRGIEQLDEFGIGKPFLKFQLPDKNGNTTDIHSYLGKVTLVDFWASWCKPCREKHPDLIRLRQQFQKINFDILSISIDENKDLWTRAIRNDNLTWTNLVDSKKEVYSKLEIQAIPFNYLLDEKGTIIGINLSIEQIGRILQEKASR